MRITFILPPDALIGGIRVLATYAHRLAARGHQVTVLQPRGTPPTFREIFRSLRHQHALPQKPDRGPSYFDALQHSNLRRIRVPHAGPIAAEEVPDGDIIIATWWETAEWIWNYPRSKGDKVHFIQGYETWGDHPGGTRRVEDVYRLDIPKIVIAQWLGDMFRERFSIAPVATIGNAVDLEQFHAPRRGKQSSPTIGFVYSPHNVKGADIAIAAIRYATKKVPALRVISFGHEDPPKNASLPANIHFTRRPAQESLRNFYGACDAWLFASRREGFGLPILEAMACRTPVIATPAGAAPELLSHGGGIEVPHDDPRAMADAICRIASMSEEEWQFLSTAAHATAAGYTWDDATERLEAALQQLHASRPIPQPA